MWFISIKKKIKKMVGVVTKYSCKPSFSVIEVVTTMFLHWIFNKADSADQL